MKSGKSGQSKTGSHISGIKPLTHSHYSHLTGTNGTSDLIGGINFRNEEALENLKWLNGGHDQKTLSNYKLRKQESKISQSDFRLGYEKLKNVEGLCKQKTNIEELNTTKRDLQNYINQESDS